MVNVFEVALNLIPFMQIRRILDHAAIALSFVSFPRAN